MSSPVLCPPYRAEQIGSLKRPAELLQKRDAFEKGTATQADLKPVEDKAIAAIVEMQREAGIKAMTDGEFRRSECSCLKNYGKKYVYALISRHMFFDGVFDNLEGMKHLSEGMKCLLD